MNLGLLHREFIKETLAVGVATMVIGLIISTVWMRLSEKKWPSWRIQGSVAGSLFLTGAAVHVVAEASGVNKWYCKHGVACRAKSS